MSDSSDSTLLNHQTREWRQGRRPTVEELLDSHPEARGDSDLVLDLIYNESQLRRELASESPPSEDFKRRFPQLAIQIDCLWYAHETYEKEIQEPQGIDDAATLPKLPGYEILRMLGQGAQGKVYLAKDLSLPRHAALKILRGPRGDQRRLMNESQVLARLDHPNIVRVYSAGETDGMFFIAMEYLPGVRTGGTPEDPVVVHGLKERLGGDDAVVRLFPEDAVKLILPVVHALADVHEKGIVHRDIKPGNLLFSADGHLKLTDFGLARTEVTDATRTTTEGGVGTPRYMAPEQLARNIPESEVLQFLSETEFRQIPVVSSASDIYGLGVTLFECVSGSPLFARGVHSETRSRITGQDAPDIRSLSDRKIPRDLCSIIQNCVAPDPGDRYESAVALAADLQRFLNGEPTVARPLSVARRSVLWCRRNRVLSTAIALLTLLAASATYAFALRADRAELSSSLLSSQLQGAKDATDAAVSRAVVAETEQRLGAAELEKTRLAAENQILNVIPKTELATNQRLAGFRQGAALSALEILRYDDSSERRAFLQQHIEQALIPVRTSSRRILTSTVHFSPDSRLLLSCGKLDAAVHVWDLKTGEQIATLAGHYLPKDVSYGAVQGITFLPGESRRFVSVGIDRTIRFWQIKDVDGDPVSAEAVGDPIFLEGPGRPLAVDATSEDGGTLAISDHLGQVRFYTIDGVRRKRNPIPAHENEAYIVLYVPGTSDFVTAGADGRVRFWNANGELMSDLPLQVDDQMDPCEAMDASFSPDGRELAVATDSGDIVIINVRQRVVTRRILVNKGGDKGTQWVYANQYATSDRLWTCATDGFIREWDPKNGNPLRTLQGHGTSVAGYRGVSALAVSPDATRLATVGYDGIKVWDLSSGDNILQMEGTFAQDTLISTAAFCEATGELMVAGGITDNRVRIYETQSLREINAFDLISEGGDVFFGRQTAAIDVSPDGGTLVTARSNGDVMFWETATGAVRTMPSVHLSVPIAEAIPIMRGSHALAWSPNGRTVASLGADQSIKIIDVDQQDVVAEWNLNEVTAELGETTSATERLREMSYGPWRAVLTTPLLWTDDGGQLLVCRENGSVEIWDVTEKRLTRTLDGPEKRITAATLSADHSQLICGYLDGTLLTWDLASYRQSRFSRLMSLRTPQLRRRIDQDPSTKQKQEVTQVEMVRYLSNAVTSLAASPNGRWIAACVGDGSLALIDQQLDQVRCRAIGPEDGEVSAAWSQVFFDAGNRIFTASSDGAIREWDMLQWGEWPEASQSVTFPEDSESVESVAAAPDGSEWCGVTGNEFVRWNAEKGDVIRRWSPESGSPYLLQYGWLDGRAVLVTVTLQGEASVISLTDGAVLSKYSRPETTPGPPPVSDEKRGLSRLSDGLENLPLEPVSTLAVHPAKAVAATSWYRGRVELWSLRDGSPIRSAAGELLVINLPTANRRVDAIAFHPLRDQIAISDEEGDVTIWNSKSGALEVEGMSGPKTPRGFCFSPNGEWLVQTGVEPFVFVWDSKSGRLHKKLPGHDSARREMQNIPVARFSADSTWLATGGADGTIHMWDAKTLNLIAVISTLTLQDRPYGDDAIAAGPATMAFSTDSHKLFVGFRFARSRVYDLEALKEWLDPKRTLSDALEEQVRRLTSCSNDSGTAVPVERNRLNKPLPPSVATKEIQRVVP